MGDKRGVEIEWRWDWRKVWMEWKFGEDVGQIGNWWWWIGWVDGGDYVVVVVEQDALDRVQYQSNNCFCE